MEKHKKTYIDLEKAQYMVAYDIDEDNKEEYPKLYELLEEFNATRIQRSVWVFNNSKTTKELLNIFKDHIKKEDKIFVTQIANFISNQ